MIVKLSLNLPDDQGHIGTMRLLSRDLMEDAQVDLADIDDVETIVGELCSNVVRHARSQSGKYSVVLEYYKPRLVITVTDEGPGFVVADVAPIGTPRPDMDGRERLGGFGLVLLEGLSDKIDFTHTDPHGTTVRVEKNLHYETRDDEARAVLEEVALLDIECRS